MPAGGLARAGVLCDSLDAAELRIQGNAGVGLVGWSEVAALDVLREGGRLWFELVQVTLDDKRPGCLSTPALCCEQAPLVEQVLGDLLTEVEPRPFIAEEIGDRAVSSDSPVALCNAAWQVYDKHPVGYEAWQAVRG